MNTETHRHVSAPLTCNRKFSMPKTPRLPLDQRDDLIAKYLPLVRRIAYQVRIRTKSKVDLDELIGWGTTGLLEAIDRYIAGGKASFSTFAYYRIRGAMLDGIGHIAPLSRKCYRQDQSPGHFRAMAGSIRETEELRDQRPGLSPIDLAMRGQLRDYLHRAIAKLPAPQKSIVMDYYFKNQSLKNAGQSVGVTKSGASRAHATALKLLREEMESSIDAQQVEWLAA